MLGWNNVAYLCPNKPINEECVWGNFWKFWTVFLVWIYVSVARYLFDVCVHLQGFDGNQKDLLFLSKHHINVGGWECLLFVPCASFLFWTLWIKLKRSYLRIHITFQFVQQLKMFGIFSVATTREPEFWSSLWKPTVAKMLPGSVKRLFSSQTMVIHIWPYCKLNSSFYSFCSVVNMIYVRVPGWFYKERPNAGWPQRTQDPLESDPLALLNNVSAAVVNQSDSVSPSDDCQRRILTVHSLRLDQPPFPSLPLCCIYVLDTWLTFIWLPLSGQPTRLCHCLTSACLFLLVNVVQQLIVEVIVF